MWKSTYLKEYQDLLKIREFYFTQDGLINTTDLLNLMGAAKRKEIEERGSVFQPEPIRFSCVKKIIDYLKEKDSENKVFGGVLLMKLIGSISQSIKLPWSNRKPESKALPKNDKVKLE